METKNFESLDETTLEAVAGGYADPKTDAGYRAWCDLLNEIELKENQDWTNGRINILLHSNLSDAVKKAKIYLSFRVPMEDPATPLKAYLTDASAIDSRYGEFLTRMNELL